MVEILWHRPTYQAATETTNFNLRAGKDPVYSPKFTISTLVGHQVIGDEVANLRGCLQGTIFSAAGNSRAHDESSLQRVTASGPDAAIAPMDYA
jgi:hypothetical protein